MKLNVKKDEYAIVFPGQGSQSIGMLGRLATRYDEIKRTFDEASTVLGYDLWDLVQYGSEDKLNQTEFTQPALMVAAVAVWRIWIARCEVAPKFLAGHSLGEYAALVCAEAMDFKETIRLIEIRGKLMQNAYNGKGIMIAIIGLDDLIVSGICDKSKSHGVMEIANYNSIGQTVVAGEYIAAEMVEHLAKEAGAKMVKILPVSVPSHCSLMKSAAESLRSSIAKMIIRKPKIPVIHNVDAKFSDDVNIISESLVKQLYSSVQWVNTIKFIINNGVNTILECGPGKVLSGLNKRISSDALVGSLGDEEYLEKFLEVVR